MVEKFNPTTRGKKEKPKKPEDYFEDLNNLLIQISHNINTI